MNVRANVDVNHLVRAREPGFTLPADLYTSSEAFDIDLEVFFRRHWIVAGVEADVPEAGDAFTVDIGKTSVIIVRDDDDVVRGFHNVCRHRGARLIQENKVSVGRIVCPYHQWSYALDGELVYATHMGKALDKSCLGLRPVHVKIVGGLVMICVAEDAPEDIADLAAVVGPRLSPMDLGHAKIAYETTIVEEGNWKLSVDNNRECYHCSSAHPELCNTLNGLDIGFDPDELSEEEIQEWQEHDRQGRAEADGWERAGYPSALVENMGGRATIFRTQRFALGGEGESHTLDGRSASDRLLGHMTERRMGDLHLWTHNSWHHFFADHAVVSYILPLSPNRTMLRTVWLVNKDAREGQDYDLNRLTEVWTATNQQDADLVGLAQRGVETTGYVPGPLSSFVERLVSVNLDWYVERLKAHGY